MPKRQPHHPEGVPETAAATATALGKKGQRPRASKSFYPQHQSPLQPVWGTLFRNIQKEQIRSRGGTEALPDGSPWKPGDLGFPKAQTLRALAVQQHLATRSNRTQGGHGESLVGPALWRLKQEDCKFQASLSYTVSSNQPGLCVCREALSYKPNRTSKTTKTRLGFVCPQGGTQNIGVGQDPSCLLTT